VDTAPVRVVSFRSIPTRRRADVIATQEYRQFIGGGWVDAADGASF
jgi:hypothetical protein